MNSLLARVFVAFWLAIVLFALAAAGITTLNFLGTVREPREIAREAEAVLVQRGRTGLEAWLDAENARHPRQRLYIIDPAGQDILGRVLPGTLRALAEVRSSGSERRFARERPGHRMRGLRIRGTDGTTYRLRFDPPLRRGPFTPPFSPAVRSLFLGLAIGISGLVSYLLVRSISRPLRDLGATARTFATGRLDVRTNERIASRRDEIGTLAREFDAMAGQLSALVAARQQLLRDLSHELRSPLARLQMALGLARQGADPKVQLDRIDRESNRLASLVAQILAYARLERDPSSLQLEDVQLAELVRQIVHDAEYESQSPPGRIDFQWNDGGQPHAFDLQADPRVLHSAIDNLLRNALLHGGPGAINIHLTSNGEALTLTVRDHGRGVPQSELARIFEPFYRVTADDRRSMDAARSAEGPAEAHHSAESPAWSDAKDGATDGRRADGSGIGLAVAARAIALHGGTIHAENAADGGLRVIFSIPRRRV